MKKLLNIRSVAGFTNLNTIFGFLIAWLVWKLVALMITSGWFTVDDGLLITTIFTVITYARLYVMTKIRDFILTREQNL